MKKTIVFCLPPQLSDLSRTVLIAVSASLLLMHMPLVEAQVVWSLGASNQNFDVGVDYDSLQRSMGIAKVRIKTTVKSDRSTMYEDLEFDCQVKKVRKHLGEEI